MLRFSCVLTHPPLLYFSFLQRTWCTRMLRKKREVRSKRLSLDIKAKPAPDKSSNWEVVRWSEGVISTYHLWWKIASSKNDHIEVEKMIGGDNNITLAITLQESGLTNDNELVVSLSSDRQCIGKLCRRLKVAQKEYKITSRDIEFEERIPQPHSDMSLCTHGHVVVHVEVEFAPAKKILRRKKRSNRFKEIISTETEGLSYELPDLFSANVEALEWIPEDSDSLELPNLSDDLSINSPTRTSSNTLSLPDVIYELIFTYLPLQSLLSLGSCCSMMRELVTTDDAWKNHYWQMARHKLSITCLPSDYYMWSDLIEQYHDFPDRLFERCIETRKSAKLERELLLEKCRQLKIREAIRVKFQQASPQILFPSLVLFVGGCVTLVSLSLLERTDTLHYKENTYRYVVTGALVGLYAAFAFLALYSHYTESRYSTVFLMGLTQCGGFITSGAMLIYKSVSSMPYRWIHCALPLIFGIAVMLFIFIFDFLKTLKKNRIKTRQKIGDFASLCIALLPLTVTVLLGTSSLSCPRDISCCLKVFWPILFVFGILLPWPPFYAIHWMWNSPVRHWRRDFFPCICFYLLYVIAWVYVATMCGAFCFAPTFGLTLLTILLSILLILLLLGWEFAIANGSSFL